MSTHIVRATMVVEFEDGTKQFIPCDFMRQTGKAKLKEIGGFCIRKRAAWANGKHMHLTERQYRLMFILWQAQGGIVTRDEIAEFVWSEVEQASGVSEQSIDALVRRSRWRLDKSGCRCQIITERGRGFRLAEYGDDDKEQAIAEGFRRGILE